MKRLSYTLLTVVALMFVSCDAFRTLNSDYSSAQGRPYELIVVCDQGTWTGEAGEKLREVLTAPVPYLNQEEPLFDLLRVLPAGFSNMMVLHRNILKVEISPSIERAQAAVQYDVKSKPQIVVTLQAPDTRAAADYLAAHGEELVQVFEKAERDRSVANARRFNNPGIEAAIEKDFGFSMPVPKGYRLAVDEGDFLWARYEYPTASQGFFIYSYPYAGSTMLTAEALTAARNSFAARIPGPADGSYMTTSTAFDPDMRTFRLDGRPWVELRGFWDVEGDFMGGPFVSYTTVDTSTNRVVTIDCYVYAPNLNKPVKRNYMRELEHLLYGVEFPRTETN